MNHPSKNRVLRAVKSFFSPIAAAINALYSRFEQCAEERPLLTPAILALLLNLLIEMLGRRSVIDGAAHLLLHPYVFFINALILFVTLLPAFLFSRRAFVYSCVTTGWLILGITNFVLLGMRNTPLAAIDFGLIVSCFGILHVYLNLFQIILIVIGILLLLLGLVRLFRRTKKQPIPPGTRIRRMAAVAASAVCTALILGFSLHIRAFTTEFPDLAAAYSDYGFAYCFSLSVLDRGIDRPVDYSGEEIGEILDNIGVESDTEDLTAAETTPVDAPVSGETPPTDNTLPNVIFVQLESFFDVKRLKGISFSEDPTPVFTALKDTCPSGYLTVPSIGAGTANTEFEILSGMNLDDFGAGEYPYKTVLRTATCESMAYHLRALGHTAHALHNNTGTFYERHRVYSMLGFDTFVPLEHMTGVTCNPLGWAKDAVLTKEIRACLDSTPGQDFVFAVSVQPHGKYPDDTEPPSSEDAYDLPSLIDRLFDEEAAEGDSLAGNLTGNVTATLTPEELASQRITVSGIDDEGLAAQYRYYVNQLYETDAFIGALIADLSAADEDTVLVLYGDHLPCFDYTADDLADGSTPYETEYVIWSNYGMTADDRNLHAYQLAAHVQSCIGTEEGIITRLHQTYLAQQTEGSDDADEISRTDAYLSALEMLEYDMLYGDRAVWDGISPYLPTDLRYGIRDVQIHSIRAVGTSLYLSGENFTPFSRVLIGDEMTETIYVDETTLLLPEVFPEDGEQFTVIQAGADGVALGASNVFIFSGAD
ncbi:MAG: hypothetical protein E7604_11185 [Ruminococcaceae bacterium]|nr:hypothetical protein [Oscillospiraceae bacterium]